MTEGAIIIGMDSEFEETEAMMGVLAHVKVLEQRIEALENYIYNNSNNNSGSGTSGGSAGGTSGTGNTGSGTVNVDVDNDNNNIAKIIDTQVKAKIAELQDTIVGTDMVDEVKSRVLSDQTLQSSIVDAVIDKLREEG